MLNRKKISVSMPKDQTERLKFIDYAQKRGIGLEVTSFANPSWYFIRNKKKLKKTMNTHIGELEKFTNVISMHGPIMDIIPHAVDEDIRNLSMQKVETAMKLAGNLGAKRVVFHTGINPVVTAPGYYRNICKHQAQFWNEVLDSFKNQIICLENMWEPDTKILRSILKYSGNERLRICLDVAHANVYGKIKLKRWFKKLSDKIVHIHINDNDGKYDEHLAVGDGNIDWETVFGEIVKLSSMPRIVIETPDMNKVIKSLKFVRSKGYLD